MSAKQLRAEVAATSPYQDYMDKMEARYLATQAVREVACGLIRRDISKGEGEGEAAHLPMGLAEPAAKVEARVLYLSGEMACLRPRPPMVPEAGGEADMDREILIICFPAGTVVSVNLDT